MTVGPSNLRALKAPLTFIRTGAVRWFEAVTTSFQSLVAVYAHHVRRNTHSSGPSLSLIGRLVCRHHGNAGTGLDQVTNATGTGTTLKYPTQALYESAVAGVTDEWFARTIGVVQLSAPHAFTPGTVAYLDAGNPGFPTNSSASGIIVGIFCASPYLLFLPHN